MHPLFYLFLLLTLNADNINPIEKLERSSLIVAATIHHIEPVDLIAPEHVQRVAAYSPMLMWKNNYDVRKQATVYVIKK